MYQLRYLLQLLITLQISRCRQILSNEIDSQSGDSVSNDEVGFDAPVIVDVVLDNSGADDVYVYRNLPKNETQGSKDLRRCSTAKCGKFIRKRPASKDYPTNVHCRGILVYCKAECVALSTKHCGEWIFLCPNNTVQEIPKRCTIQCIHNFRQMRIKFPVMASLSKFTNPRYDRFDYQ